MLEVKKSLILLEKKITKEKVMTVKSLIARLNDFFLTQPVDKAWLFGSFSRDEATPQSDIDIMVRFNRGEKIGLRYFKMIDDLERIFGRAVDLAEEGTIDSHISNKINEEKILIYERNDQR